MSKRYNLEITKEGRKSSLYNVSEETLVGAIKDWAMPVKIYNLTEIKITFMGEEL